jgi:hypothetical protein
MLRLLFWTVVGVLGALFVLFLVLALADLKRVSGNGPRWKRGLVKAGMLVLTSLGLLSSVSGVSGCATCYVMVPIDNTPPSVKQARLKTTRQRLECLSGRLELLNDLMTSRKLEPAVIERVLSNIEMDISVIEKEENMSELTGGERDNALWLLNVARAKVEDMRMRLSVRGAYR